MDNFLLLYDSCVQNSAFHNYVINVQEVFIIELNSSSIKNHSRNLSDIFEVILD